MSATSKNKWANEGLLIFMLMVAVIGLAIWWFVWVDKASKTVISSRDAGLAVTATYSESSYGAYVTRIETDKAVFQVQGTVPINKGDPLTLEERKNGDKLICRLGTKDCRVLTD